METIAITYWTGEDGNNNSAADDLNRSLEMWSPEFAAYMFRETVEGCDPYPPVPMTFRWLRFHDTKRRYLASR